MRFVRKDPYIFEYEAKIALMFNIESPLQADTFDQIFDLNTKFQYNFQKYSSATNFIKFFFR